MKSGICGIDPRRGSGRGATIDGSRGFQPTGINDPELSRRGATVEAVALRGVASGFRRRSATRFIFRDMVRGLKPTATISRSRRDEEAFSGRGATNDGSRAFQRPDHQVSYSLRRGATVDPMVTLGVAHGFRRRSAMRFIFRDMFRGLKPTATISRSRRDEEAFSGRGATNDGSRAFQRPDHQVSYSLRRGATVDPVVTLGVAHGFRRRSATRFIFRDMVRGLKPTATIMKSRRDEEAMPMADDEWAMGIEKNLEGLVA